MTNNIVVYDGYWLYNTLYSGVKRKEEVMRHLIIILLFFTSTMAYGHDCDQWKYSTLDIVRTKNTANAIWHDGKERQEWNRLDTKDISKMNNYFNLVSFSHIYFLNAMGDKGWELASSRQSQKFYGEQIDSMVFKKCSK